MSGNNGQRKRGGRNQGNNQQKKNGAKRKSRGRSRSKRVDPAKYWGDRDLLVIPESYTIATPDTSVVATSLGRPPIPGQENASKHYFSLVYDRAAMLATALAAAGDIENMQANADRLAEELRAAAEADDETDDLEDEDEEGDADEGHDAASAVEDATADEDDEDDADEDDDA